MADFIHKEGTGVFFPQQKKTEKSPDYKGELMIAGNLYELAGWNKQGKNGTFISLSAQVKGSYKSPVPDVPQTTTIKPNAPINVTGFDDFEFDEPPF